jgi:hypothetical protein
MGDRSSDCKQSVSSAEKVAIVGAIAALAFTAFWRP